MIELRDLRNFLTVADEQHFGRAARRLNIGETPLSEQIRALEQSLGITLFQRDRRRAQLTAAGATLVSGARRTLSELERALDDAQRTGGDSAHQLRVACSSHAARAAVPALLQRFRDEHPNARVDLISGSCREAVADVVEGKADAACVTAPVDEEALSGKGVRAHIVHRERFSIALPAGHYLLQKRQIPLKSLWNEDIAFLAPTIASALHGLIVAACNGAGFSPRVIEADSFDAVLATVAERGAIGLLPASYCSMHASAVEFRALSGMTATADIVLLYLGDASPLAAAFAECAQGSSRHPYRATMQQAAGLPWVSDQVE